MGCFSFQQTSKIQQDIVSALLDLHQLPGNQHHQYWHLPVSTGHMKQTSYEKCLYIWPGKL